MPIPFGSPFVDPRKRPVMPIGPGGMPAMGGPPGMQGGIPPMPPGGPMTPSGPSPIPGMGPAPVGPQGMPGAGPMGIGPPGFGSPTGPPPRPPADIPPSASGGPMTPTIDGPISQLAQLALIGGMGGGPMGGGIGRPPAMGSPGGLLSNNSSLDAILDLMSRTDQGSSMNVGMGSDMGFMASGPSPAGPGNPGTTQQEQFLMSLVNQTRNQSGQESLLGQVGPGVEPGPLNIDEQTMMALLGLEGTGNQRLA